MRAAFIDAREQQKRSIDRMLKLQVVDDPRNNPGSGAGGAPPNWKTLVLDKRAQDIIAPLFTVGTLRGAFGITLYALITANRTEVPDVPCIYFVEPTEDNVNRIIQDCRKKLYPELYVNFTSSVSPELLQRLAHGLHEIQEGRRITQVVDRFVNFISLGPRDISLNLDNAYTTLRSMKISDDEIGKFLDRIVTAILSVLITLKIQMPIIRTGKQDATELVGQRLHQRLYELSQQNPDLFSPGVIGEGRPVLALLDRDLDLCTMLHHTWTYGGMCSDVLNMKLNKMTITGEDGSKKAYDVDPSDKFWIENNALVIHEQFENVDRDMQDFQLKQKQMNSTDLTSAIGQLPEMQERKRSLEMHTNVAHAILAEIQKRGLDRYYSTEDAFLGNTGSQCIADLKSLIGEIGEVSDKERAILVLYLLKQSELTDDNYNELISLIESFGGSRHALAAAKHSVETRKQTAQYSTQQLNTSKNQQLKINPLGNLQNNLTNLGNQMGNNLGLTGNLGNNLTSFMGQAINTTIKKVQQIIPVKKELITTKIITQLMLNNTQSSQGGSGIARMPGQLGGTSQPDTSLTDNFTYIEPKLSPGTGNVSRFRGRFQRGIVVMIGGGNSSESQAMKDSVQEENKDSEIIYTTTSFVNPTDFLAELQEVGRG